MSKRASVKGSKRSLDYQITTWSIEHLKACIYSLAQIKSSPFASMITIAVIGVSLSLPAGFYLVLNNAASLTENWAGGIQISLFMDLATDETTARQIQSDLLQLDEIKQVDLIDKEQAFNEYRLNSGFSSALDYLDENPLPYVLLVYPADSIMNSDTGKALLNHLSELDSIDSAQFDRQWANRLLGILEILQRGIYLLSVLLAFAVLLIIGNTIRLGIFHRRTEIEINKLFGATDAFIQRPFLYSGFIHGLVGGIMAWGVLFACVVLLDSPVLQLANLYETGFTLQFLSLKDSLILILCGAMLGLCGSWLAVKQHIRSIGLS